MYQEPLLESQAAFRLILGKWLTVRSAAVANEVRNAGDDSAAPVVDKWLGLI